MTRKDQIRSAYRLTGGHASFYDGMMTYSTLPGKAICRLVWNMDGEKNLRYLERALSGVPEDFSGKLLEVPVGTGVLTMPVYRELPKADITCLDYSADMMAAAQTRKWREFKTLCFAGVTWARCLLWTRALTWSSHSTAFTLSRIRRQLTVRLTGSSSLTACSAAASISGAAAPGRTGSLSICTFPRAFLPRPLRRRAVYASGSKPCIVRST